MLTILAICCMYTILVRCFLMFKGKSHRVLNEEREAGVPLWHSRLRIWHCHCSSLDHCCGSGSILGLGTSICHGHSPKNKTKQKKEREKLYGIVIIKNQRINTGLDALGGKVVGGAWMVPAVFAGEGVLEWPQKTGRFWMKGNRSFGSR